MKIWERYLLKEILKVFGFCLIAFYSLFSFVEYSINSQTFQSLNFLETVEYLFHNFIVQAEILIPVALAIASTRVLYTMSAHSELVAFLACGFRKILLIRPFLILAATLSLFLYVSEEFFLPKSLLTTNAVEERFPLSGRFSRVNLVNLPNDTKVIYQHYSREQKSLFDVYWRISKDELMHMTYLFPFENPPIGKYVDILKRNDEGALVLTESHLSKELPVNLIPQKALEMEITDPIMLSLSEIIQQMRFYSGSASDRQAKLHSVFYQRLLLPLSSFVAIFLPASFFFQFSRRLPIFFIYSFTFFGVLLFFTLMDTAQLIAEHQVFPVLPTLFAPPVLFSLFFAYRFRKMQ